MINGQATNLIGELDDIWFESIVTESKQCNACNQFVNAGHKMFSQDNTLLCEICFLRGFAARTLRRLAEQKQTNQNFYEELTQEKKKLESAEHKLESMREFNKSALETIVNLELNRAAKQTAQLASQRSPENNLLACDPTEPIEYEIPAGYQLVVDRPQPSTLSPGEIVKTRLELNRIESELGQQMKNIACPLDFIGAKPETSQEIIPNELSDELKLWKEATMTERIEPTEYIRMVEEDLRKKIQSGELTGGELIKGHIRLDQIEKELAAREPRFHCEDCRRQAERLKGHR